MVKPSSRLRFDPRSLLESDQLKDGAEVVRIMSCTGGAARGCYGGIDAAARMTKPSLFFFITRKAL
jgi:hypothetical protein